MYFGPSNWAKFKATKGAVKLHLKLDGDTLYPEQAKLTTTGPIRYDGVIRLRSNKGHNSYPGPIRMVRYHDDEYDRDYVFITNNFELVAQEIADIYKSRWQVELFFKWIQHNLKIKTF